MRGVFFYLPLELMAWRGIIGNGNMVAKEWNFIPQGALAMMVLVAEIHIGCVHSRGILILFLVHLKLRFTSR